MPLGHLGVNVPDLLQAKAYYDLVMPLLEYEFFLASEGQFAYQPQAGEKGAMLFFYASVEAGDYSHHRSGLQHLAFIVKSRESVNLVHDFVARLGDQVLHAPQEFPQYHDGYYATFWLDPFGHMLEAVCHQQLPTDAPGQSGS